MAKKRGRKADIQFTDLSAADGLSKNAEEVAIKRVEWLRKNADAIESYNKFVAMSGIYSDGSRGF